MTQGIWAEGISHKDDKYPDSGTKRSAPGRHTLLGLDSSRQEIFLYRGVELTMSEGLDFAKNHPYMIAIRLAQAIDYKPHESNDAFVGLPTEDLSKIAKVLVTAEQIEEISKRAAVEGLSFFTADSIDAIIAKAGLPRSEKLKMQEIVTKAFEK